MLERLRQAWQKAKDRLRGILSGFKPGAGNDGRSVSEAMERIRKKTEGIYAQAEKEILYKLDEHANRFRESERLYSADERQYAAFKRTQVYTGGRWENAKDAALLRTYNANAEAARLINAERAEVYRAAYNRTAYEIEKRTWQAQQPHRGGNPLPAYRLNEAKDAAWNARKITAAVQLGIASGEALRQTDKRIAHDLTTKNRDAMLHSARTLLTGAQNAGRDDAMRQAQASGIRVRKMWIATLDHRTRDAHRELDGQIAEMDQPFVVYGEKIRFPGDPLAKPELIYNCRCTLGFVYPDYDTGPGMRRDNETGQNIPYVTYREWEKRNGGSAGSSTGRRY